MDNKKFLSNMINKYKKNNNKRAQKISMIVKKSNELTENIDRNKEKKEIESIMKSIKNI